MIEQHPKPETGFAWPEPGDRPRRWAAHGSGAGEAVVLRHYAILKPGEVLDEYPPTVELSWAEWQAVHADYGLNVDGTRIEEPS